MAACPPRIAALFWRTFSSLGGDKNASTVLDSHFEAASWGAACWPSACWGALCLPGCARNEQNGTATGVAGTDASITGSGELTTGPGGEGAGPTGTEGDAPADNPASQASEEQQKAEQ